MALTRRELSDKLNLKEADIFTLEQQGFIRPSHPGGKYGHSIVQTIVNSNHILAAIQRIKGGSRQDPEAQARQIRDLKAVQDARARTLQEQRAAISAARYKSEIERLERQIEAGERELQKLGSAEPVTDNIEG